MLKSIFLRNFKSARQLSSPIPLKSLTIFSGLNGSGKSTVLQSIALLRQSLEVSESKKEKLNELNLRGSLVQLGTAYDILSERALDYEIEIELKEFNGSDWKFIAKVDEDKLTESSLKREVDYNKNGKKLFDNFPNLPPSDIENYLRKCSFQFLQADRLIPKTHYDRSSTSDRGLGFLGTHGEYTPDFLSENGSALTVREKRRCPTVVTGVDIDLMKRISATPKLFDQINGWLQYISPGVRLDAEPINQTDLVTLGFSYASTEIAQDSMRRRPTNVGFGLTYSLPIITACLSAPQGALLLLENPEAHLHPRGQAALGTLLAKCANDGIQILVETHSDHLLNGIRLAVKNGIISSTDTSLCHFVRDTGTGDSYINNPNILPNGELSSWPEGFFDEWENSLEELLK